MRIEAFHAGDGDCLLLSSPDPKNGGEHHVLVDGGRSTHFQDNARDRIYGLDRLDVVCVSHIDEDHIAGVLRILEDEVAWRVFDFEQSAFDAGEGPKPKKPGFPRPPVIAEIWHNALFELVGDDLEVEAQGALTASAGILTGSSSEELRDLASRMDNLATGERSALELSRRMSDRQLGIPRNRPLDQVMLRGENEDDLTVGSLRLRILGPSRADIERLRATWSDWIEKNADALRKLREELRRDEERLGSVSAAFVANPMLAASLGEGLNGVSAPNLASLMLLAEEDGKSVLLTGDGVSSEVLDGLEHHGVLDGDRRFHADLLKVQHHGALANITEEFVQRVSADHYLFCGNGAHHNPEIEAVESMVLARLTGFGGKPAVRPDRPFKLWFTSSPRSPKLSDERKRHMEEVEAKVEELRRLHDPNGDRFDLEMLDRGALTIEL